MVMYVIMQANPKKMRTIQSANSRPVHMVKSIWNPHVLYLELRKLIHNQGTPQKSHKQTAGECLKYSMLLCFYLTFWKYKLIYIISIAVEFDGQAGIKKSVGNICLNWVLWCIENSKAVFLPWFVWRRRRWRDTPGSLYQPQPSQTLSHRTCT